MTPTAAPPVEEEEAPEVHQRAPIYPMNSVITDHLAEMSAWFLAPFVVSSDHNSTYRVMAEPDVPQETRDYVYGTRKFTEAAAKRARSRLARLHTIEADVNAAFRYMEAGNTSVRESARRQGCVILQQVEGERSEGTLSFYPPTMEACEMAVEEMKRRLPWALAQIDARIDQCEAKITGRGFDGQEIERQIERADALRERRITVENGVPTPQELYAFFMRFERVRAEAAQDPKYRQQKLLDSRVDMFRQLEQQALGAANSAASVTSRLLAREVN